MQNPTFIGKKEIKKYPLIGRRTELANQAITNSKLIKIPNCEHNIAQSEYIQAIKQNI